jgi:Na+/H+ antiporter NhaC
MRGSFPDPIFGHPEYFSKKGAPGWKPPFDARIHLACFRYVLPVVVVGLMCASLMMHGPRMMAMVAMIRAVVARVITVMDRSMVDDPMG